MIICDKYGDPFEFDFRNYYYRIPKIEEFIFGFVYEIYSNGFDDESVEDFCGWYIYTFGEDDWRDIEDIGRELKSGNIRTRIK